jgi:hypothetical protein
MVTVPFKFNNDVIEHEFIGFLIGGVDGGVYRKENKAIEEEPCQQNNHCAPYMVTHRKVLKPHSQAICVSDLSGGKLPSGIDCFFSPSNELPVGVRIHAFTSGAHDYGKHKIVLSNDTHKAIKLSRGFPLGAIYYKYTTLATKNTLAPTYGRAQSNTEGPVPSTHPNTHTHTPTQHEKIKSTL